MSGKDIRAARRAREMSQDALGAALTPPVNRSTVSLWERDLMRPSGDEVYEFLGLEPPNRSRPSTALPSDPTAYRSGGSLLPDRLDGDRPLDAMSDPELVAAAQDLNAQAARLMAILAGRMSVQVQSVQPPTDDQRDRMRRGPLDERDRPAVDNSR